MSLAVPVIWKGQQIASQTATPLLRLPFRKELPRRKIGQWSTKIHHPLSHCEGLPIPEPSIVFLLDRDEEEENKPEESQQPYTSGYPEIFLNLTSAEPHKITQKEYSGLIRDLKLSKRKAELLSSRLQQLNLLDDTVKMTAFCSRQDNFEQFSTTQGELSAFKIVRLQQWTEGTVHKNGEYSLTLPCKA